MLQYFWASWKIWCQNWTKQLVCLSQLAHFIRQVHTLSFASAMRSNQIKLLWGKPSFISTRNIYNTVVRSMHRAANCTGYLIVPFFECSRVFGRTGWTSRRSNRVGSLMSLAISSRMREDLEFDVLSILFTKFASVGAWRAFLGESNASIDESSGTTDSPDSSTMVTVMHQASWRIAATSMKLRQCRRRRESQAPTSWSVLPDLRLQLRWDVHIEEMSSTTDLFTMGIDSLMSLPLWEVLREKIGLAVQSNILAQMPPSTISNNLWASVCCQIYQQWD